MERTMYNREKPEFYDLGSGVVDQIGFFMHIVRQYSSGSRRVKEWNIIHDKQECFSHNMKDHSGSDSRVTFYPARKTLSTSPLYNDTFLLPHLLYPFLVLLISTQQAKLPLL